MLKTFARFLFVLPLLAWSANALQIVGMISRGGQNPLLVQDSMIAYVYFEPLKTYRLEFLESSNPFLLSQFQNLKVGRIYSIEADLDPVEIDSMMNIPVIPTHVKSIKAITAFSHDCKADLSIR